MAARRAPQQKKPVHTLHPISLSLSLSLNTHTGAAVPELELVYRIWKAYEQ